MTKHKARLSQLADQLHSSGKHISESKISEKSKSSFGIKNKIDIHPPRGERGDFRKITVTLPPEIYDLIITESYRRKRAREENSLLGSIVREALLAYLSKPGMLK